MRLSNILKEARAHSEKNPKRPINLALQDRVAKSEEGDFGMLNLFVSFTQIEKLGINPQSVYNTPMGIYAYPAEYVISKAQTTKKMSSSVPFAGDSPWVNIFSTRGNIVNLGTMEEVELDNYKSKMFKILSTHLQDIQATRAAFSQIYKQTADPRTNNLSAHIGGDFWFISMKVAELLASGTSKVPVMWNKLFRQLGIDGFVDPGLGIIHRNEKTQAVFFSIGAITDVQREANKYSPEHIDSVADLWQERNARDKDQRTTTTVETGKQFAATLTIQTFNNFFNRYVSSSTTKFNRKGTFFPPNDTYPWRLIGYAQNYVTDEKLRDHIIQLMPGLIERATNKTTQQIEYVASLHIGYLIDLPKESVSERTAIIGASNTPSGDRSFIGLFLRRYGFPAETSHDFNRTIQEIFPLAFLHAYKGCDLDTFRYGVYWARQQGIDLNKFLSRLDDMHSQGLMSSVKFTYEQGYEIVNSMM